MLNNQHKKILDIIVGGLFFLFFAYVGERLFHVHELINILNYHIGTSTVTETNFLYYLIVTSSTLSNYMLLGLFLTLVVLIILIHITNYGNPFEKENEFHDYYNILLSACIFYWILIFICSFISSITNFNILIEAVEKIPIQISKELSTTIGSLLFYITYFLSVLSDFFLIILITFILTLFLFINNLRNKNNLNYTLLFLLCFSCLIGITILIKIAPNPELMGNYYLIPAGPHAFLGSPVPKHIQNIKIWYYKSYFILGIFFSFVNVFKRLLKGISNRIQKLTCKNS